MQHKHAKKFDTQQVLRKQMKYVFDWNLETIGENAKRFDSEL